VTATKPERAVVVVTDDTTKAELAITIGLLNDNAKRIHRRGYIGVHSPAYECEHKRINALLDSWQDARA
jgi:hypothetical protein